jgi:hypothetical protein
MENSNAKSANRYEFTTEDNNFQTGEMPAV